MGQSPGDGDQAIGEGDHLRGLLRVEVSPGHGELELSPDLGSAARPRAFTHPKARGLAAVKER